MKSHEDAATKPSQDDAIKSFARLAERYCDLIDGHSELTAESFLHQVHGFLPLLYSAALELPDPDADDCDADETVDDADDEELLPDRMLQPNPDRRTHDQWQTMFDSLRRLLASRDRYCSVFDPYSDGPEPPGFSSLSDDFADIYWDLMYGLKAFRRGMSEEAAWRWRLHFNGHWAAHASSALRAIEALASMHNLGFPPPTALP